MCDGCGDFPIKGQRFNQEEIDYCENCFKNLRNKTGFKQVIPD